MNESRQEITNLIDKYFDKKLHKNNYNKLKQLINKEKDIFVLKDFVEKSEYYLMNYGSENEAETNSTYKLPDDEVLDNLIVRFRLEQLNHKREKGWYYE